MWRSVKALPQSLVTLGRKLLDHFDQIGQVSLLTDDAPRQHDFYAAMGFQDIDSLDDERLHVCVVLRS